VLWGGRSGSIFMIILGRRGVEGDCVEGKVTYTLCLAPSVSSDTYLVEDHIIN
jgi:hypothetical protein